MIRSFLAIFLLIEVFAEDKTNSNPIIELTNGKILGKFDGNYYSFRSIRYAEPPTGLNRFEPPKPYADKWNGIRDATKYHKMCMQWDLFKDPYNNDADLLNGDEDCLFINVYTPDIYGNETYPVLIYIHGGGFTYGATYEDNMEYIMADHNTVYVDFQYRVGPLGFLSTEDNEIAGNMGLKDQRLALEWIKDNIHLFNGNRENITLVGFSAGAASVELHLLRPETEKLVSTAISISGSALCAWVIVPKPFERTIQLAKMLNCSTQNTNEIKQCLKKKPAEEIVRAVQHFLTYLFNPFRLFGPVIESKTVQDPFLTKRPEEIIKSGQTAKLPWLISFVSDEGTYPAGALMQVNKTNGKEYVEEFFDRFDELAPTAMFYSETVEPENISNFTKEIRRKYCLNDNYAEDTFTKIQRAFTDIIYLQGIEKSINLHKNFTESPIYVIHFDYPAPYGTGQLVSNRNDYKFGVPHGDDLFLIMKTPFRRGRYGFNRRDEQISGNLIDMIHNFATTGIAKYADLELQENKPNQLIQYLKIMRGEISLESSETFITEEGQLIR